MYTRDEEEIKNGLMAGCGSLGRGIEGKHAVVDVDGAGQRWNLHLTLLHVTRKCRGGMGGLWVYVMCCM